MNGPKSQITETISRPFFARVISKWNTSVLTLSKIISSGKLISVS